MEKQTMITKEWLVEQFIEKDLSIQEVAKFAGVGKTTICRNLYKFEIRKFAQHQEYRNKEWLLQKYSIENFTTYQIANLINVSRNTICNWLREFGIEIRQEQGRFEKGKLSGCKHYNWKGGITELNNKIRNCEKYRHWRLSIFKRDFYSCQSCKYHGKNIHADHIKPFYLIVKENNIKTLEQAIDCEELWSLENGRTLCVSCHKQTGTWGRNKLT